MIVTRRRRKQFKIGRLTLPIIALAVIAFAFWWPPSHAAIFGGRMAPIWSRANTVYQRAAAPFHFAAQNRVITARNREIATLKSQLTAAQQQLTGESKKIVALKTEFGQAQAQAAVARTAHGTAPIALAGSSPFGVSASGTSTSSANDLSAGATPDMRRTAAVWAAMEPGNAAKVVQRLPVPYVARVLSLMSADAASQILDSLPASAAAKLTQENPGLRK